MWISARNKENGHQINGSDFIRVGQLEGLLSVELPFSDPQRRGLGGGGGSLSVGVTGLSAAVVNGLVGCSFGSRILHHPTVRLLTLHIVAQLCRLHNLLVTLACEPRLH